MSLRQVKSKLKNICQGYQSVLDITEIPVTMRKMRNNCHPPLNIKKIKLLNLTQL